MKPIYVLVITVLVGALTFYGGIQFQKSRLSSGRNGGIMFQQGQRGMGGAGVRRMGNGAVIGEILGMDETSLTIKLVDGSSRIVLFTDKTTLSKTAPINRSELKVGERVSAFGSSNPDGSVTAQNIQLNPQIRQGVPMNGSATGSAR